MDRNSIEELVSRQREFFYSGATLPVEKRIVKLTALKEKIKTEEKKILEAIQADLGKSSFESYMCEIGLTLDELSYMIRHVKSLAKEKRVPTPLAQFASRSFTKPSPYGVVLIMSPWNYPFLLTMEPLVDAIAAGNTVIVKPSAYSPHTSAVIKELLESCFSEYEVAVVTGGREENEALLKAHFDYIFFTGSKNVGRTVLEKAAVHLTPVTLELGGKSPCIVTEDANLKLAAKRLVFGKYLNCGQTCVAPDYVLCQKSIKDRFLTELKKQIVKQYGKDPFKNKDYGKIINQKHFNRVCNLIDPEKIAYGGRIKEDTLQIEPTILDYVVSADAVMQEEIFGPILPILTYDKLEEAIRFINKREHPLALYLFTSSSTAEKKVLNHCGFGGGCINDTIIHLATHEMGFGGFGESGMGSYHGKKGFETFSHDKSIVDKKTWIDLPMRYQPYKQIYDKMIRMFLK